MTPTFTVAVVIATYGRNQPLVDAVRSVIPQLRPGDQLVVVDQTDQHDAPTKDFLTALGEAWVRMSPPSLPAARNLGIARTQQDLVVFVDDDVVVDPGFLDAHRASHARHPGAGVVGGRVRVAGRHPGGRPRMSWLAVPRGSFDHPRACPTNSVLGCNMSWKREVFHAVGDFDTRFTGNAVREESEMCWRAGSAGWEVWYDPAPGLEHLLAPVGGCREPSPYDSETYHRNEQLFLRLTARPARRALATVRAWRAVVLTPTTVLGRAVRARHTVFTAGQRAARAAAAAPRPCAPPSPASHEPVAVRRT